MAKRSIQIGDLRHRVELRQVERITDGGGGAAETWQTLATLWAAVMPISANERVHADAVAGEATHDIWLRFRDDVRPDMRITFGVREFEILGVINVDERRRWLRLYCEERDL